LSINIQCYVPMTRVYSASHQHRSRRQSAGTLAKLRHKTGRHLERNQPGSKRHFTKLLNTICHRCVTSNIQKHLLSQLMLCCFV